MGEGETNQAKSEKFDHTVMETFQQILDFKGNVEVICMDGREHIHIQLIQLFSFNLFHDLESLDREDIVLLCPEFSIETVKQVHNFLTTGRVSCNSKTEQNSVIRFLHDFNFIGEFNKTGEIVNLDLGCDKYKNMKEYKLNEFLSVKREHFDDAMEISNDFDYLMDSEKLNSENCVEKEDMEEDEDNSVEKERISVDSDSSTNKRNSKKDSSSPGGGGARVSLKLRLKQFPDLAEFHNNVVCKVCKVLLDWTKRGRINDHMKSQKHTNRALKIDSSQDFSLSEEDKIKIMNQIKNQQNIDVHLDGGDISADLIQDKLSQRLADFPWLQKIPRVEAVQCSWCKCPVDWNRRSHILDHSRSKKHIKAAEEAKKKFPGVLKSEVQTSQDKISNDRTTYRITLKQGTPSIQKLWCAALLTNSHSIVTEVRICYICLKLFLTNSDLMIHSATQHEGVPNKLVHSPIYNRDTKEFFCGGCNKFTEAKRSILCFLVHNLICTKKFHAAPTPIKCLACQERFIEYKQFREHLEGSHAELLPERLMCTDCPISFLTNVELKRHVNQVHTDQYHACTECPATFKNKISLKDHVIKQHIRVKNFSCDQCGKEFYGKNNLRMHMRIHMAPENRPHACNICGFRFIERKHLTNHQATHTSDRPHKCHLCDSRFKVRDWLSSHYIKHHNISIKEIEAKLKNNQETSMRRSQATDQQHIQQHALPQLPGHHDASTTSSSSVAAAVATPQMDRSMSAVAVGHSSSGVMQHHHHQQQTLGDRGSVGGGGDAVPADHNSQHSLLADDHGRRRDEGMQQGAGIGGGGLQGGRCDNGGGLQANSNEGGELEGRGPAPPHSGYQGDSTSAGLHTSSGQVYSFLHD